MAKPNYVKNVFNWDHMYIYLSGPIDSAQDGGRGWRDEWTDGLVGLGIKKNQVLNPCRKPLKDAPFDFDDEQFITQKYRDREEWDELCKIMSQIAHMDLRLTDKSDVVLVNFPKRGRDELSKSLLDFDGSAAASNLITAYENMQVHTYGTIHEIVVARQQRKPVYIVWEGGKKDCSSWLMWLVGHDHVFDTFNSLKSRLREICTGQTEYNANDWLHLDLGR